MNGFGAEAQSLPGRHQGQTGISRPSITMSPDEMVETFVAARDPMDEVAEKLEPLWSSVKSSVPDPASVEPADPETVQAYSEKIGHFVAAQTGATARFEPRPKSITNYNFTRSPVAR